MLNKAINLWLLLTAALAIGMAVLLATGNSTVGMFTFIGVLAFGAFLKRALKAS